MSDSYTRTTLFLDFDGVTHPELSLEKNHFRCLPSIEEVLRELPQVDVVISSTWRLRHNLQELRHFFSHDIAPRVVDITPHDLDPGDMPSKLMGYPRHAECWQWMRLHRAASDNWVALDDRPWLFRPHFAGLVVSNMYTGVDLAVLDTLKSKLLETERRYC